MKKIACCLILSVFLMLQFTIQGYARIDYERVLIYYEEEIKETKYYDVPLDDEIQDYIREMLNEFEVDIPNGLEVVLAVAAVESRFKNDVVNGNCRGIMQVSEIHSETLEELGIKDLHDPYDCFKAGIYYLKQGFDNADKLWNEIECELEKEEFRLNCALMSYNLEKYGAKNKILDGIYFTSYVEKVYKELEELELRLKT